MKIYRKSGIWFLVMMMVVFISCQEEQIDKYERPEFLSGKLYTQIDLVDDLDSFAVSLNRTGYDTIVDASGSFTIFAPTNEAFIEYFNQKDEYSAIKDIPLQELDYLVKYHIVQNSWTISQLQSLDIYGWIDEDDPSNDEPRGFKRQTVLREDNEKYWVNIVGGDENIVDSLEAVDYRMVHRDSRKYVPFFFDRFMEVAGIETLDYEFYFTDSYLPGNIHFAGAHVMDQEIFAENGIVYKIDKIVEPLPNAEQLLKRNYPEYSYSDFLNTIYKYGVFTENEEATISQPGYAEGLEVDKLYDLNYPELTFNISSELTGLISNNETYTIRYHNGLIAPTNRAMKKLFDEVITEKSGYPHWPDRSSVPSSIFEIIINTHMSKEPVYLSDFTGEVKSGMDDDIILELKDIIQKSYASNCTFLGVDEAIVPRAFSSVSGPVYLRPGFSIMRKALEKANVMSAIKKKGENYSFFIVPDFALSLDSSMLIQEGDNYRDGYIIRSYDRSGENFITRNQSDLMLHFFNHIGIQNPAGSARKEFIPNLAGNYIVIDNEANNVTGGVNSTFGFNGDSTVFLEPVILDEPTDNGITYEIGAFLSFTQTEMYSLLTNFPDFAALLGKAGFIDSVYYDLNDIVTGEKYTVFVPSSEAIQNSGLDTLSRSDLKQVLNYHFIKGEIIFTDGKTPSGSYSTLRVDESSTIYQTRYSSLNIQTAPDRIEVLNENGSVYYQLDESEDKTNIMFAEDIDPHPQRSNYVTKGVVHVIDTVLIH